MKLRSRSAALPEAKYNALHERVLSEIQKRRSAAENVEETVEDNQEVEIEAFDSLE